MTYMAMGEGDSDGNEDRSYPDNDDASSPSEDNEKPSPRLWLERMRKDHHWSQREVAKKLGCAQQTYQRFEAQGIPMSDKWFFRLAEIFDVPVARLIALDGGNTVKVGAVIVNGGDLSPQDHPRVSRVPADMEIKQTRVAMIDDDSLEPRFYAGDLVFYDTVVESFKDAFYKDCVVALDSDQVFLRRVMPGRSPRVVTIEGYNEHVEPILNVEPAWIAPIRWVRLG